MKTITRYAASFQVRMLPTASLFFTLLGIHSLLAQELWDTSDIRRIAEDRIGKEKRATAIVIGTFDKDGSRVIACGKAGENSTTTADGNTVFEIGSVSKVFTSLLLADMVQGGEVKLEDPISKSLPGSVKAPARNGKAIRLVDLATHRSGLPRLPDNLEPADNKDPYADYSE